MVFLRRLMCVGAVFFVFGTSLFAATVSIMVVETGVNEDAPRLDASSLWEGGLMDVLFDTGHIVSNAPILRLTADQAQPYPEERLLDIEETLAGGANYYILAVLNYESQPADEPTAPRPRTIALRFVRIQPHKILFEQQYRGNPAAPVTDELQNAKKAARNMLSHFEG
ncbi:hypothetical protein [Breznakiella homolactica]|uniref:Uncharacterized protein n=1 Tax=Breznakiella homolactica TaxID=2798577 RepID=A0A7T7XKK0_9SPIR|nr:hypothetical protein [Breznakiella homolactica]QQO08056.1 hypothetical protein JFL75_14045 [Breznakiella homolactica]